MKVLIDAQLPARLAARLAELGHDAVHTSALPEGNRTTDSEIAAVADQEQRVVVTKDADFRHSHLGHGTPQRLLVVATGNISNSDLLDLFQARIDELVAAFDGAKFVELHRDLLVVHGQS